MTDDHNSEYKIFITIGGKKYQPDKELDLEPISARNIDDTFLLSQGNSAV